MGKYIIQARTRSRKKWNTLKSFRKKGNAKKVLKTRRKIEQQFRKRPHAKKSNWRYYKITKKKTKTKRRRRRKKSWF